MEQNLSEMQGGIENSTIIMRDFKTPLSIENVGKRSIGKELNNIISLQDLTDSYSALTQQQKNTFLSNSYGTVYRIDHMLCYITSISDFSNEIM